MHQMMEQVVDPCPYLEVPTDYDDVIEAVSEHPLVHSSAVVASDWETGKHFGAKGFASAVAEGCIHHPERGVEWEESCPCLHIAGG